MYIADNIDNRLHRRVETITPRVYDGEFINGSRFYVMFEFEGGQVWTVKRIQDTFLFRFISNSEKGASESSDTTIEILPPDPLGYPGDSDRIKAGRPMNLRLHVNPESDARSRYLDYKSPVLERVYFWVNIPRS